MDHFTIREHCIEVAAQAIHIDQATATLVPLDDHSPDYQDRIYGIARVVVTALDAYIPDGTEERWTSNPFRSEIPQFRYVGAWVNA